MGFFSKIFNTIKTKSKPIVTVKPMEKQLTPYEYIKSLYESKQAKWEEINIFGIRFEENQNKDIFNDYLCIAHNNIVNIYKGTTDPGKYWTENGGAAGDSLGVAHLCEGYHHKVWQVGIHLPNNPKVAHEALIQTGNAVPIWRDKNRDYENNDNILLTGYWGINCHRANYFGETPNIGLWSAGCQVFASIDNFAQFLSIIKNSISYKQNNKYCFSYFLFNNKNIDLKKLGIVS